MRFLFGTLEQEKGAMSMALTELYSELIGRGYIKSSNNGPRGPAYFVTSLGLEHEGFLRVKHSIASNRVAEEVRSIRRRGDPHMALLSALVIHDRGCQGCEAIQQTQGSPALVTKPAEAESSGLSRVS